MYAVYNKITKALVSTGGIVATDLDARGLAAISVPTISGVWNPNTLTFDPHPPEYKTLTSLTFLQEFTTEERIAIRTAAKTDLVINDFLEMLNLAKDIDTGSALVVSGIAYLVTANILSTTRQQELAAKWINSTGV